MRLLPPSRFIALGIALLISGCASQPTQSPYVGFFAPLKTCHARYAEMDAKVAAADAQHAAYYRVPGYPYLRTNRLLASFAHEVDDLDEIGGWVRRMRELDQEAREYEFINLGLPPREVATLRQEFLGCGRGLASIELADDPEALAALRAAKRAGAPLVCACGSTAPLAPVPLPGESDFFFRFPLLVEEFIGCNVVMLNI